ncbi:CLUMA_CG013264, isoform A [Clunio marinus]|uniref:CLUMA_CG013264, isoform A n=1 Tax=Clunio marinus TaxID=568069 RepID=A0A1J1INB4_9DIPT|nr:CLUMA_CG013264, isoform A [Clunio marinus]
MLSSYSFMTKFLFVFSLSQLYHKVSSNCLFPPEFEGRYIIQNALVNSDVIQYSTINITADYIYPYGQCFSRNESNVIVMLGSEESACYRCFSLRMVSRNVILLIHNEIDINSKCSSSADIVKCPEEVKLNDEQHYTQDFHSIILYRTSERDGPRRNEFCPFDFFDGDIKFDYYLNEKKLCNGLQSTLSQCPSGSSLNIRFKGCEDHSLNIANYECIGHWNALNKHYLAFIDWINGTEPRYKCSTYYYENDEKTKITLTINNDCSSLSTRTELSRNNNNQQIFKIEMKKENHKFLSETDFPVWLHGQWQFLNVLKNELVFRDQSSFKSYSMTLMNQLSKEKFIVLSRSQCGEESFKCLWIRKLDENILEFQVSSESSKKLTSDILCNDEFFDNSRWITQSRTGKDVVKTSCPIEGEYFGQLPDALSFCAVMKSNCNSPDIMYFQIGICDTDEIFEKRVYQCLGQWTTQSHDKKNSTVYTLTKRIDEVVNTYECFVGIMAGEKQFIIREAGENCYKMLDPYDYGMLMNQTAPCQYENQPEDRIIVKPTQDDSSITYETVYDGNNNNIDFNTVATTKKTEITTRKHKNNHDDANSIENDMDYQPTHITSSAAERMIHSCGLLLMIWNLQNSIIVRNIL